RMSRPPDHGGIARRRIATTALLGAIVVALALSVPALHPVVREIGEMDPGWVGAAVALELASCLSFVVIFRLFFERVGARDARALGIAAIPWLIGRRGTAPSWIGRVVEGIRDAQLAARHPSWRLAGALGYLGFDIAVLWATFSAIGHAPPVAALVLGYTIGYAA